MASGKATASRLRRVMWPLAVTSGSIALLLALPWVTRAEPGGAAEGLRVVRLLLGAIAYLGAAWLATTVVGLAVTAGEAGRRRAPKLLQELSGVAAFAIAVVATITLVFEGSLLGAAATSGILVAIIGFSLRGVMADVFAGIAFGLERTYRIGDWIELENGLSGRVVEISWRATRIETRDRVHAIVPNGRVAQQRVMNYSAPRPHFRQQLRLTLDHALAADEAKRLLAEAAASAPGILAQPAPDARLLAYEPEGLVFAVRYWVPSFGQEIDCRDAVLTAIDAALRRRAVPAPHRRHRVRLEQSGRAAVRMAPHPVGTAATADEVDARPRVTA